MADPEKNIISTKDIDPEGKTKEFTVSRKYQFNKEDLLRRIKKLEESLAELNEMLVEFGE